MAGLQKSEGPAGRFAQKSPCRPFAFSISTAVACAVVTAASVSRGHAACGLRWCFCASLPTVLAHTRPWVHPAGPAPGKVVRPLLLSCLLSPQEALRSRFVRRFVETQLRVDVDQLTERLQTYGE